MSIDHMILGVISLYPCSGYDMKVEFEKGGAGMLSALSFGSIYPRLKQMEQAGLIETQQVDTEGRHKKVYELTAKGWQELAQWLEEPSEYPLPIRDELLLKMIFWGSSGQERYVLIEHLHVRREESRDLLNYIAEWQSNGKSFIDEYAMLLFTYLQMRLEAELKWIETAITQLEGPPQLPVQDPKWFAVLQKARRSKALGLVPEDGVAASREGEQEESDL
ncbi:MAG TPA: PadR family transcriptional regulator [Ktedonosporobacter sp.]|nr:PadR family transcriptional regulator [Ktedonosporobacter sp.]